MNNKGKLKPIFLFAVIVTIVFLLISLLYISAINERNLYKIILKADIDLAEISVDGQQAESYYDEASYAYENGEYNLVENNCRLARDSYSEESQGYKRIRAELISTEIEDKLIDIYVETLEIDSEISLNMFEACEHFEVAARHYNRYMTDLTTGDDVWEMGNDAIESMNEKIRDHDDNVRDYNDKLEEYRIELKLRIENDFAK